MKKIYQFFIPALFILGINVFTASCKKTITAPLALNTLPVAQGSPITLQVDAQHAGNAVAPDYLGLSFEMSAITNLNYFNTGNASFVQLIKNLGTGVFRIGGNSVDKTFWTGRVRTTSMPLDSISTTDIDRFKDFINAIQWKVIFGVNCGGYFNPAVAANEVAYVNNVLPTMMHSFEVGNEADLYPRNGLRTTSYTVNDFNTEWNQYYTAIKTAVPSVIFSGGAFANNRQWLSTFLAQQSSKISLATIHFYQTGPGTDPSININSLLSLQANTAINVFGNAVNVIANGSNLPYRVAECNSIYGGGAANVSNSFAASLWAIDYMFKLAYTGCKGINFHGGGNGPYTPIGYANGTFFAKPEYYSMLFFKDAAKGNLLPCNIQTTGLNITAYASKAPDGTTYVSILNKETQTAVAVNLTTGNNVKTVTLASLTAPDLTATTGLVFAGRELQSNGQLTTTVLTPYAVNAAQFNVNVPAGSAVLVTIQP